MTQKHQDFFRKIPWIKFNRAKNNNRKSKLKESSKRNSNRNWNIRSGRKNSKEVPKQQDKSEAY